MNQIEKSIFKTVGSLVVIIHIFRYSKGAIIFNTGYRGRRIFAGVSNFSSLVLFGCQTFSNS